MAKAADLAIKTMNEQAQGKEISMSLDFWNLPLTLPRMADFLDRYLFEFTG